MVVDRTTQDLFSTWTLPVYSRRWRVQEAVPQIRIRFTGEWSVDNRSTKPINLKPQERGREPHKEANHLHSHGQLHWKYKEGPIRLRWNAPASSTKRHDMSNNNVSSIDQRIHHHTKSLGWRGWTRRYRGEERRRGEQRRCGRGFGYCSRLPQAQTTQSPSLWAELHCIRPLVILSERSQSG